MKYRVNNLNTELYRVAWDYATGKIGWETVKYMRESILARYDETREEMMRVWKQKFRYAWNTVNCPTPY